MTLWVGPTDANPLFITSNPQNIKLVLGALHQVASGDTRSQIQLAISLKLPSAKRNIICIIKWNEAIYKKDHLEMGEHVYLKNAPK